MVNVPFSNEHIFSALNGVLPAWILLAVAPRWRLTAPIVTTTALVYAALYVALLARALSEDEGPVDFFTYKGVVEMFKRESSVLPSW
jgi:hypothetical protein